MNGKLKKLKRSLKAELLRDAIQATGSSQAEEAREWLYDNILWAELEIIWPNFSQFQNDFNTYTKGNSNV